jgi:hypothetical protein
MELTINRKVFKSKIEKIDFGTSAGQHTGANIERKLLIHNFQYEHDKKKKIYLTVNLTLKDIESLIDSLNHLKNVTF